MQTVKNTLNFYWQVLKQSVAKFSSEEMPTHAAALSFYMVFSLPFMLLIILRITSQFYREVAAREAIFAELGSLVGEDGAQQVMNTIEKLAIQEPTWWATALAVGALLFTATNVFEAMRTALNRITQARKPESAGTGILTLLRVRFTAFALLVSLSFILLVFLIVDAVITALGSYLVQWLGQLATYLVAFDAFLLDMGATIVLFALYFRYLPDTEIRWRDIWFGALLTATLYTVGKYLIALIIGNSETADLYDAAGSILVLMLWVYYAATIFLFGATFTFTRANLLSNKQAMTGNTVGTTKSE